MCHSSDVWWSDTLQQDLTCPSDVKLYIVLSRPVQMGRLQWDTQMKQSFALSCAAAKPLFHQSKCHLWLGAVVAACLSRAVAADALCISPCKPSQFMKGPPESSFEMVMPHRDQSSQAPLKQQVSVPYRRIYLSASPAEQQRPGGIRCLDNLNILCCLSEDGKEA